MATPSPRDFGGPLNFGDILRGPSPEEVYATHASLGAPGTPRPAEPTPGGSPVVPWQRQDAIQAGVPYRRVPIYPPFANLAADPRVVYMTRVRPFFFGGAVAAGVQPPQQAAFSQPTIVYARSAAAIEATGGALPVGRGSLDTFSSFMARTNGDSIDGTNTPILGSAILGTAGLPALYACNAIFFNAGSTLMINLTTLLANIRVDIVLWTIEEYGNPSAQQR